MRQFRRPRRLQSGLNLGDHRIRLFLRNDSLFYQALRPDFADTGMTADFLVHQGLREGGFLALIMPVAAVADQIYQEILAEFVAVSAGHFRHRDTGLRLVGVDMDNRISKPFAKSEA